MSEVKYFEIRDAGTFMPVMAVRLTAQAKEETYLLYRAGFDDGHFIALMPLEKDKWTWEPNAWSSRTLQVAHEYLLKKWNELPTGAVIDVKFILGLQDVPKKSERLDYPL